MTGLVPDRRQVAALALALGAAGVAHGAPKHRAKPAPRAAAPAVDGMALGSPTAKVTVVEYASLSCPHCARWANDVFPAFKAKYIDTGKVRYILREFLTAPAGFAAAGWMLARCAGPGKYFTVVEAVFRDQDAIYQSGDVRAGLLAIARANGMTEEAFEACLNDKAALAALQARVERYGQEGQISATPTFVVGTKKLTGEQTLEDLDAAIAAASKPARRRG